MKPLLLLLIVLPIIAGLSPVIVYATPAKLKIISPHNEFIKDEFSRAFSAYYLANFGEPVDVEWVDVGGTDADVRYIRSGFAATPTGIGIDLFWGGGVDPYIALAEENLFETYQVEEEILKNIPKELGGIPMYDSKYRWYGTALSGFGIIYNKQLLSQKGFPEPKTWEDLTNPKLKGWVGSAGFESGTIHMMFEIMLQGYGWEKGLKIATLLGANVKNFPASSSAIPKAVSSGDVAYGLAIDFYAWAEISKVGADKIGYVLPSKLTTINPDSIAILKGAPNMAVAKRFVSWVLTKPAQRLWMQRVGSVGGPTKNVLGRMSVIPELYDEIPAADNIVPVNPFKVTEQLAYNATKGSIRWSLVTDLLTALIVDSHEQLKAAWGDIIETNKTLTEAKISSPKIQQAIEKLTQAPISEAEGLNLSKYWSDAAVRNKYIAEWHVFAQKKYADAHRLAVEASIEGEKSLLQRIETYRAELEAAKIQAQNNIYYGLGGGVVLGLIVGVALMTFIGRRREVAAVAKK
ncbi:MAG: extracellular solute-binding protein [Candidatus Bathyarchaeia archaeon]